jgi:hypothetical protein
VTHTYRIVDRRLGTTSLLLTAALVGLLVAPYGVGLLAPARATQTSAGPGAGNAFSAKLLWNGVDASTAPTPSSAITWSFSTVSTAQFVWHGGSNGTTISQAFLVIVFLGLPGYTKQQVESPALPSAGGGINMSYDASQFQWFLQGLYQLHGYLQNPNGSTVWSETFYVRTTQPLTVVSIGLIALIAAELYMIATVGPRALDRARRPSRSSQPPTDGPPPESTASAPGGKN